MKSVLFLLTVLLFASTLPAQKRDEHKPVRAVWLTNVDSKVLLSNKEIKEAVKMCKDIGLTHIFVVTWNKGMPLFKSPTMKKYFGIEIDSVYGKRDPLKELIAEAHKNKIKVYVWFEFGFSASYKENGGHIIKKYPSWKAIDNEGKLVTKNNFEWMNGFHPDVQNFILSLISDVVKNYDIDGIQGDDRLPAMPSEAGYDPYTVDLWKMKHNGQEPPKNTKDSAWVQFRADLMTDFMAKVFTTVKKIKKNVTVSMSPSLYPWAKEEYLQDWPEWMRRGYVELICPQLYRYEFERYKTALDEIVDGQIEKNKLNLFAPGILLKVGSYYPSEEYLRKMIKANREKGVNGEVFFFYEGFKKYPDFFLKEYKTIK